MKNTTKILKLVILAFAVAVLSSLLVTAAFAETVASGNFATAVSTATWTYTLDSDGTLTIGGKASDGSTTFTYGADMARGNCPWQRTGIINGIQIKKVILLEETGITALGATALSYLPYCEEIVLPATVTSITNYEAMCGNPR
ncbi:MAG: hypothetical protein IKJ91_03710, partial [Clostridia bacterium]|nr:hypothetical protein [Clostridia bacterium]